MHRLLEAGHMVRGSGEGKLEMGTEGGVSFKRSREAEWAAVLRSTPPLLCPLPITFQGTTTSLKRRGGEVESGLSLG